MFRLIVATAGSLHGFILFVEWEKMDDDILLALKRSLTRDDGPAEIARLFDDLGSASRDISLDGFKRLMSSDLSFGQYGMPLAQHDQFLRVMAMTAFQPYNADVLTRPRDVLFVLTPIMRILSAEAAILMHMTNFEGSASVPVKALLPYRPRSIGFAQHQYGSLLDIIRSVWFIMCHAYVELLATKSVRSLACYTQDGKRARHIWVEIDTERAAKFVEHQKWHPNARENFEKLDAHNRLLRIVSVYPPFEKCTVVVDDLIVFTSMGAFSADYGVQSGRYLSHSECVPTDAIRIETLEKEPYVCVAQGSGTGFLLVTTDGCCYSAFYRLASWSETGLTDYPLHLHPYDPEVYDQDDPDAIILNGVCTYCGRATVNGTRCNGRIYCGSRCITEEVNDKGKRELNEHRRQEKAADTAEAFVMASARGPKK
jgi:hypothetical protein